MFHGLRPKKNEINYCRTRETVCYLVKGFAACVTSVWANVVVDHEVRRKGG